MEHGLTPKTSRREESECSLCVAHRDSLVFCRALPHRKVYKGTTTGNRIMQNAPAENVGRSCGRLAGRSLFWHKTPSYGRVNHLTHKLYSL